MTFEIKPTPICSLSMMGNGKAANVGDLVTALNITESIGIDTDLEGPLNAIAEALEAVSGEVD